METDRLPDNPAKPLYEAVVEVKFDGIYPPSCEHPSYIKCAEGNTCFNFQGEVSGICKFTHPQTPFYSTACEMNAY